MDETHSKLLVPFDDDSPSFTNGVEAGMVWQRMQDGDDLIESATPYHAANHGVLQKMADAMGYDMAANHLENEMSEWTEVTFTKRRVVRGHLSVAVDNSENI